MARARSSATWILLALALLIPGSALLWMAVRQSSASGLTREVAARAEHEARAAQNARRPRTPLRGTARACDATRELSAVWRTLTATTSPRGDFNPIIERGEPLPAAWVALTNEHPREVERMTQAIQCDHGARIGPLNADGFVADNVGAMARGVRMVVVRALGAAPDACLAGLADATAVATEAAWADGLMGALLHEAITRPVPQAFFRCAARATPEARARAAGEVAAVVRALPPEGHWAYTEMLTMSLALERAMRGVSAFPTKRQDLPMWWDRPRAVEILHELTRDLPRWETFGATATDPAAFERELAAVEAQFERSSTLQMATTAWTRHVHRIRAGRARLQMLAIIMAAWVARDATGRWPAEAPALAQEPAMRDPFRDAPLAWRYDAPQRQLTLTAVGADRRAGTGDDVFVSLAAP